MTNIAAWLVAVVPLVAPAPPITPPLDDAAAQAEAPPPPPQYTPPPPPQGAPPPPPEAFPRREKQRRSWYIGFGIGTGSGAIRDAYGSSSFGDYFGPGVGTTTFTFEFQIGATVSPRFLLGADWMLTGPSATVDGQSASLSIQTLHAVLTYFPDEKGLFVRAGVGFASYAYDLPGAGSSTFGGVSALGGIGYAFWLGRSFNLTLNLDASAQTYWTGGASDPLAPDSSWFWTVYLGFAWY